MERTDTVQKRIFAVFAALEPLQDTAVPPLFVSGAAPVQRREVISQELKLPNPRCDVFNLIEDQAVDFIARLRLTALKRDETRDVFESQPQIAAVPDEMQPCQMLPAVDPVVVLAAKRRFHETFGLIKTNGFNGHSRHFCQLADAHAQFF